jgi:hypothetical protein
MSFPSVFFFKKKNQKKKNLLTSYSINLTNLQGLLQYFLMCMKPKVVSSLQENWPLATKRIESPLLTPHQRRQTFVAADEGSIAATLESSLMRRAKIKNKK